MKILNLQAENVKKLVAVEIKPDGNLVQITGKNGAGKTSVLDSIWWALAGAKHIQSSPIRQGAKEARIRLDLGELIVLRTFKRKEEGGATTSLVVESADGARFPSPQGILDALLGALTFDPLEFARMDPAKQFHALRQFAPEVDFDAIDNARRGDFERRTEVNRQLKQLRANIEIIRVPENTPDQEVDIAALARELEEVGRFNTELETRKARREAFAKELDGKRDALVVGQKELDDLLRQVNEQRQWIADQEKKIADMAQQLADAPELPAPKDTVVLRGKIDGAKAVNDNVREKQRNLRLRSEAGVLEREAEEITARIEARDRDKAEKIAAAKIPVPELSFGDGIVLYDGQPFDQASDAQQLRASVAIAMASNPKLRVIRIRDGSLLDSEGLALLAAEADKHDMQVWIERVDDTGKIGVFIEDGHVKAAEAAAANNPTAA